MNYYDQQNKYDRVIEVLLHVMLTIAIFLIIVTLAL